MDAQNKLTEVIQWCASILGPVEILTDESQQHAGQRASTYRLRTPMGACFLKFHRDPDHWENEVHAYEHWAPVFGSFAPRLLAAREIPPLAIVITEQPGTSLLRARLPAVRAREVWRSAGQALAGLHHSAAGTFFGPCHRDGTSAGASGLDAVEHVSSEFEDYLERGQRIGCLRQNDQAIVRAARQLTPAFAGEPPRPCHRDYCPPNWLVKNGSWSGVIDFEFSYWDVPSADLSRFPNWNWSLQPDRYAAFLEGYGFTHTPRQEQQLLVSQALYAFGALVWGMENAYFVFAREGRRALKLLGKRLA